MGAIIEPGKIPSEASLRQALEERHGKALQDRFSSATVAVCGLGGLGSNIAIALARAGVGRLILIDFDRVDITNLHRQQYKATQLGLSKAEALAANLREIAPYLPLTCHQVRMREDNCGTLLQDADVVCEAFDRPEAKAMLVNAVLTTMPEKYLVAASGMAGLGPGNSIRTRRVAERFYLCGDEVSAVDHETSLVASRVMLCAAHQALTVLRILAGQYDVS